MRSQQNFVETRKKTIAPRKVRKSTLGDREPKVIKEKIERIPFSAYEESCTKILVEEVISEHQFTEVRWKIVAARLKSRFTIDRTVGRHFPATVRKASDKMRCHSGLLSKIIGTAT